MFTNTNISIKGSCQARNKTVLCRPVIGKTKKRTTPDQANMAYAKLLGIGEAQRLNLRLMEIASFNSFDGQSVVRSLLKNRDLWQSVVMDRDSNYSPGYCDLIKLRDLGNETRERVGEYWNVDTLYILVEAGKATKLRKLTSKWAADHVEWIANSNRHLGSGGSYDKVLRVWWD